MFPTFKWIIPNNNIQKIILGQFSRYEFSIIYYCNFDNILVKITALFFSLSIMHDFNIGCEIFKFTSTRLYNF